MKAQEFTDRLAETIHYVMLYWVPPSAHIRVSHMQALIESGAIRHGYIDYDGATYAVTPKGEAWLALYGKGLAG